jgi:hypothetical protein
LAPPPLYVTFPSLVIVENLAEIQICSSVDDTKPILSRSATRVRMTSTCMSTGEYKHNRAPEPNLIQFQLKELTAQKYEHGHWHRRRVAPPHGRWHDSLGTVNPPHMNANFPDSILAYHSALGWNSSTHAHEFLVSIQRVSLCPGHSKHMNHAQAKESKTSRPMTWTDSIIFLLRSHVHCSLCAIIRS